MPEDIRPPLAGRQRDLAGLRCRRGRVTGALCSRASTSHARRRLETRPVALAVDAHGGGAHGTLLKRVDNCSPELRDCVWNVTAGTGAPVPHQFESHPPIGNLDALPADIRVNIEPKGSAWSAVGRTAKNHAFDTPTMNLGGLSDDSTDREVNRVVLHEFGHVRMTWARVRCG